MQITPEDPIDPLDELIARMLDSDTFRSAPVMRTLLKYLWSHRNEDLSEYAVATDVLGRPANFDPKTDSSARVQISRLRAKLKEFYQETEEFPLKVSIPLGGHQLRWSYDQPEAAIVAPPQRTIPFRYGVAGAGVLVALAVACVWLGVRLHAVEPLAPPPLPRFWRSFLAGSKPLEIVVPSPLSFFWPDRGVNVRDLNVLEFSKWESSEVLRDISRKWGPPQLAQTYVGAPEMNAGVRLMQFLHGRVGQIELIESRKHAADAASARNTIFMGMPRTAVYLAPLVRRLNFFVERVEPDVVRNRAPLAGEPATFTGLAYSVDRVRFPGIVALLPERPEHTRSLLLLGRSPVSLATMLSSLEGLQLLDEQWKKAGSPAAWEMVVEADVYRGDTVSKVVPVAFRAIGPDFWK